MVVLDDIVAKAYGENKYRQTLAYDELGPRFFDALAIEIGHRLQACGQRVPVVTGEK
jgi:hypothetical protein